MTPYQRSNQMTYSAATLTAAAVNFLLDTTCMDASTFGFQRETPTTTTYGQKRGRHLGKFLVISNITVGDQAVTLTHRRLIAGAWATDTITSPFPGGVRTLAASTTHGPFVIPIYDDMQVYLTNGGTGPSALSYEAFVTDDAQLAQMIASEQVFAHIASGNMAADINGAWILMQQSNGLSFDISWANTGTPVGVLYVYGSNDSDPAATDGEDLEVVGIPAISGTGTHKIRFPDCGYAWIRLFYDRTSGGTANTSFSATARRWRA